jgi:hypothetical protein
MSDVIGGLLVNNRWKAVGSGARALVAQVTTTEAHALTDPAARVALESFVREMRRALPRLDGVLMLLRDDSGQVLGWGELRVAGDGFVWDASHLAPDAH